MDLVIGLAVAGLVTIVALVLIDRQDRRMVELDAAHRLQIAGLMGTFERERAAHRSEIADLCQRIQAPQMATIQHQVEQSEAQDDNFPMTDTESAEARMSVEERAEHELYLERMEKLEREGIVAEVIQ